MIEAGMLKKAICCLFLYSCCSDSIVCSQTVKRTFRGHHNSRCTVAVAFSPDGKTLVSTNHETFKLWDVTTGKERASLEGDFRFFAFSPNGKLMAAAGRSSKGTEVIALWNLARGKLVHTFTGHFDFIRSLTFSPDGSKIAAAVGRSVKLLDISTREEASTWYGKYSGVDFSPDGKLLAAARYVDDTIKIWDLKTEKERATLQIGNARDGRVNKVLFTPDGKSLVSWGTTILLWDVESKKKTGVLPGYRYCAHRVAFSPNGKVLVSAGDEVLFRSCGKIKLWDFATKKEIATLKTHASLFGQEVFSPDGKTLASSNFGTRLLSFWDTRTGKLKAEIKTKKPIDQICYSPDGRTLAVGCHDGTIELWDVSPSK